MSWRAQAMESEYGTGKFARRADGRMERTCGPGWCGDPTGRGKFMELLPRTASWASAVARRAMADREESRTVGAPDWEAGGWFGFGASGVLGAGDSRIRQVGDLPQIGMGARWAGWGCDPTGR